MRKSESARLASLETNLKPEQLGRPESIGFKRAKRARRFFQAKCKLTSIDSLLSLLCLFDDQNKAKLSCNVETTIYHLARSTGAQSLTRRLDRQDSRDDRFGLQMVARLPVAPQRLTARGRQGCGRQLGRARSSPLMLPALRRRLTGPQLVRSRLLLLLLAAARLP